VSRVLCVDDEQRVLDGLELHLGMEHEVELAISGAEGLALLDTRPFDVVVSDMRMPEMDGATFLAEVRSRAPETARILLTGHADVPSALRAVNEGHIFRFLTKPCPPDVLLGTIEEAGELVRLRRAERELLEQTVAGCVEMLTDVLGIAAPLVSRHTRRLRELCRRLGPALGVPAENAWELEVAALLAYLGSIALPDVLLEKRDAGQPLTERERSSLAEIPAIGERLLGRVPRLHGAAALVGAARPRLRVPGEWESPERGVLEVALWIDASLDGAMSWERIQHRLRREVSAEAADAVGDPPSTGERALRSVAGAEVAAGMVLAEDLFTSAGQCVVKAGTEVSEALALRIRTFASNVGLREPFRVRA